MRNLQMYAHEHALTLYMWMFWMLVHTGCYCLLCPSLLICLCPPRAACFFLSNMSLFPSSSNTDSNT